jgi:drug/metabolite transporter (DMT)-like permease
LTQSIAPSRVPPLRATLAGCGAIALWAFLGLLSRGAATIPPLQLTAMAFAVSATLGLLVVAARGRLATLRQPPLAWLHGVGGLALYHALYFAALDLAPPAEAGLVNYAWPLLIVLFSAPLLGLRLRWVHALGTLAAAAGCLLLLGQNGGGPRGAGVWLGDGLAFAAAITWALYSVLSRRMHAVPTEAVAGFCAAAALLAGAGHLAFEHWVWPDSRAILAILALGAGPLGGAFFLWDIGMKRGDPRQLGTLAYATPVLSTLLLCLGGYAPWSVTLAAAALMVAVGGLVASRGRATAPSQTAPSPQ